MTKREYLESINFNDLELKEQISATLHLIDNNYSTLEDGDSKHTDSNYKQDYILRNANKKLLEDYPRFLTIVKKASEMNRSNQFVEYKGKSVRRSETNKEGFVNVNTETIYQKLKQEIREDNLTKIISE